MRISDCSSDVCSSDLLRVADRGRLALAPEGAHLGALVQIGVGDDRARGLDELPMSEHIDERSGRHGREAGQRRLAAPEQGAETLRPFPVAIVRIGRAPIRSEEHTSELQSLMRISYAVFCLKK